MTCPLNKTLRRTCSTHPSLTLARSTPQAHSHTSIPCSTDQQRSQPRSSCNSQRLAAKPQHKGSSTGCIRCRECSSPPAQPHTPRPRRASKTRSDSSCSSLGYPASKILPSTCCSSRIRHRTSLEDTSGRLLTPPARTSLRRMSSSWQQSPSRRYRPSTRSTFPIQTTSCSSRLVRAGTALKSS